MAGVIVVSLLIAWASDPAAGSKTGSGSRIGVVYVEGTITGARGSDWFGTDAGGQSIMEQLKEAREDDSVKAVLVRINSPGGSAAAAQEIGDEIDKIKAKGKPVVASMGEVAASGGYWIAAKADKIMADSATMTGSIGVIMETTNMQELFNKIGISPQTIKSGRYKDIGSANRPMTDEEKQILQDMVNDIFQQFVDVVAKGRNMERAKVLALADGRIFTGRQAKASGLVDELGNFYDAVDLIADLAGIEGEPELYELGAQSPFAQFFSQLGSILKFNGYLSGLIDGRNDNLGEILKTRQIIENR